VTGTNCTVCRAARAKSSLAGTGEQEMVDTEFVVFIGLKRGKAMEDLSRDFRFSISSSS
jgi:hypothetical protein